MDPTTSAHIDPSMLTTTASGPDSMPGLTVQPDSSYASSTGRTSSGQFTSTAQPSSSSSTSTFDPQATGLRQRVNKMSATASEHPAVKNAKGVAATQIDQLRQILGQSSLVRDFEARTGVDRVILVVGGVLA